MGFNNVINLIQSFQKENDIFIYLAMTLERSHLQGCQIQFGIGLKKSSSSHIVFNILV